MTILPHTKAALEIAILKDLRISQSTAGSINDRLRGQDAKTIDQLLGWMLTDGLVETHELTPILLVYRITAKGLGLIS